MNDNRFAPPKATVADVGLLPTEPPPAQLVLAVRLLWVGWALALPLMFLRNVDRPIGAVELIALVIGLLFMAFGAYLNLCIRRGRNWARITTLALALLGLASIVFVPNPFGDSTTEYVLNALAWLCDVAGLALLFRRPASAWFEPRRA